MTTMFRLPAGTKSAKPFMKVVQYSPGTRLRGHSVISNPLCTPQFLVWKTFDYIKTDNMISLYYKTPSFAMN